jgi:hypothetical protein
MGRVETIGARFWLIPTLFGMAYFFCPNIDAYSRRHLGMLMFNIVLIIRYLITPVSFVLGGFESTLNYSISEIGKATGLMIYEMIAVMLFVQLLSPLYYERRNHPVSSVSMKERLKSVNAFVPLAVVVLTGVLVAIFYETVRSVFSFIFNTANVNFVDLGRKEGKAFEYVLILFVQLSTLFLCSLIIQHYYKKKAIRGFINNHEFFLMLAVIVSTSSLVLYSSRSSVLFPMISGFSLMGLLFEEKKKRMKVIGAVVVVLVLAGLSYKKQFGFEQTADLITQRSVIYKELPDIFNQYFSGTFNVVGAIQTRSEFRDQFPLSNFVGDILSNIVIIGRGFRKDLNASKRFNFIMSGDYFGATILPMIGLGYLYFGYLLSPLLSICFATLLMWCDRKTGETDDVFSKYIFLYASIKAGLFMTSNAIILVPFFINYFFLVRVIIWVSRKINYGYSAWLSCTKSRHDQEA